MARFCLREFGSVQYRESEGAEILRSA